MAITVESAERSNKARPETNNAENNEKKPVAIWNAKLLGIKAKHWMLIGGALIGVYYYYRKRKAKGKIIATNDSSSTNTE